MNDHIVRAVSADGCLKAAAILSTGIVERARQIHKTFPTATAALGRVLTAASMMGNMQKIEKGSLTLQIKGDGPLGSVLAVSDAVGNVRGYVDNPQITLLEKYRGKLDVGAAIGNGTLTVIRDLQMKEPYIGSIALTSGEIAEDITSYFARSEQIPTACALGVLVDVDQSVKAAGGFLIQLLPDAPEQAAGQIETALRKADPVTSILSGKQDAKGLLETVLGSFELQYLETTPVEYCCYCSRARVTSTLISLGKEELEKILDEGETIHVGCQFCDRDYAFTPEQIRRILQDL